MLAMCPLYFAEAKATSIAVLKYSTSSDVNSDWFGHDMRNSRMRSIVWRSLSFAHDCVTEPPSRVTASSPFIFLFEVPEMSVQLMESAESEGIRVGFLTDVREAGCSADAFLCDIAS